jgi:hypothetical protein
VTASNNGSSSGSALTSLPAGSRLHPLSLLFTETFTILNFCFSCPPYNIWTRTAQKHRFQAFLCCCAWTCCRGNLFASWSLPVNLSTRYNIHAGLLRDPTGIVSNGYWVPSPGQFGARRVHAIPRFRMCRVVPPHPLYTCMAGSPEPPCGLLCNAVCVCTM